MSVEPWLAPGASDWFAEAEGWITAEIAARGLGAPVGITRVKARPWSVVLRATTPERVVYFKAAAHGGRHEPLLLAWLDQRWPDAVPALLAVHDERPWVLMADGGTPLLDCTDDPLEVLKGVLCAYARMQIESLDEIDALIAMDVPDRRPHALPELLRSAVEEAEYLRGMASDVGARYAALAARCAELAESAHSAALDHGDLHAANVILRHAKPRLCDWGDASVTHPFCSLFVPLERTPGGEVLRDVYLAAWREVGTGDRLVSELDCALWVAPVIRVLDWVRMLRGADAVSLERWHPYVQRELGAWLCQD